MTISNVLNSCCNYCNYTSTENPIKNAIHTWYLSNGGETHLIRHDDKIEFLTIQGEKKTSDVTPLAKILEIYSSPEEFIECTIEMVPVFNATGKLEFIDTKELQLHTWERKYGSPVELFSTVHELYLKIMSDKETVLRKFSLLDGSSLEEQVSWLKERQPHVYGRKKGCWIEFEDKIKERKSAIDGKTLIDMDHWCVTMLNADSSGVIDSCSPCKWLGHSLLVIETIEEGNYFARQSDLTNLDGNTTIRVFELPQHNIKVYVKDYTKSETHKRPKEDIQRMMDRIWQKLCDLNEGKPSLSFDISGDGRPFLTRFFADNDYVIDLAKYTEKDISSIANCTKFCFTSMEVANIETSSIYKLSHEVFKTPIIYDGFNIKAVVQEGLMITVQTGLYSGVSAFGAAWAVSLGSWISSASGAALVATIVGGPIAGISVWTGAIAGNIIGVGFGGVGMAAYIGAAGGGIASLSRIVEKHSKKNSQNTLNVEPLSLKSIHENLKKTSIIIKDLKI